eukprot:superscaffoldBa00000745_g6941
MFVLFLVPQTAVRVQLRLDKNLRLCGDNETDTDCCSKPLCVLETLQVSACVGGTPQASLLIQAEIYALLVPANTGSGPFGGQVSPAPDYQCSVQTAENSPDWSPFLCVTSPPENNPYLGLFYQGDTIMPKPGPSFQRPVLSAPAPADVYSQGSPILTLNDQYFTIPQRALGHCVKNAPVAFLKDFERGCYFSPGRFDYSHICGKEWKPRCSNYGRLVDHKIYGLSSWALECGGGDVSPCLDPMETQLFPITSSVTFTDIPINTGPPKTRFQINFTEYDCNRNDVCWPELAFPITKYYTGEPYSQSLAKGLILVFFFIAASVLGNPWRQIRQVWNSASL